MMRKFVKEELSGLINKLAKDFEIIGPKELPGKGIFYQPITAPADLYLGSGLAIEPVKKFFLKPAEYLFQENFSQPETLLEDMPLKPNKRIIFGVRACEARGLTLLDKVFNAQYADDFYVSRRESTLIVGLSCIQPDEDCFCTSMAGSPTEAAGMDALLFELGNELGIEIFSQKAEAIFSSLGELCERKQEEAWEAEKKIRNNALTRKLNLPENLESIFASDYWAEASFSCIGCGICTFLCPTCHCFDLVEEERKRLRCYDSCAFSDFTAEASGVNPRPTKKERYRQRIFHKFDYFKKNFGEHLCVGCGRCIRHCPVKLDVAATVENAHG